jgi:hypothetical protein
MDRLVWRPGGLTACPGKLRAGQVEARPVAVGRLSTMHRAVDRGGEARLVRRSAPALVPGYSSALRYLSSMRLSPGFDVPAATCVTTDEVWERRTPPSPEAVDTYVASVLEVTFRQGSVVATGEPHVLARGRIVCEDVVVAYQLEPDQVAVLVSLVRCLLAEDPTGVADAVRVLCRAPVPTIGSAAKRSCLALGLSWSPASFGLALSHIAWSAAKAAPLSEPLVLLADELLHRLDLAHRCQFQPESLASPDRIGQLLAPVTQPR